jgi:hypothetical protein
MTRNTFIKQKQTIIICEESGLIITNVYNVLLTQLEVKLVAQLIVNCTTNKQQLTCSNYGKIGHAKENYHNRKREVVVPIVPTKQHVVKVTTQPIKPTKVPLQYPCIIYFNVEHRAPNFPRKTKVQNMCHTKTNSIAIVVPKLPKPDNILVNVIAIVTTRNLVLEQHVHKKHELVKTKAIVN